MTGDQGGIWAINSHPRWGNVSGFTIFHPLRHFSLDFSILMGSMLITIFILETFQFRLLNFDWVQHFDYLVCGPAMQDSVDKFQFRIIFFFYYKHLNHDCHPLHYHLITMVINAFIITFFIFIKIIFMMMITGDPAGGE